MKVSALEISKITGGQLSGPEGNLVSELLTDSRSAGAGTGHLFIALRGPNHDGHNYIPGLYSRGVRVFIVEKLPDNPDAMNEVSVIAVKDSVKALQDLASWKRAKFRGKVIGITGSAGKTIVKEWLSDIMGIVSPVIRSPKSYNSQIGVPLSVWNLDNSFASGIFEAGISHPGEMEKLALIISPETGIITNIGEAHGQNFSGTVEKCREKLKLFKNCSTVVYCADHETVDKLIAGDPVLSKKRLASWSFVREDVFCKLRRSVSGLRKTLFEVKCGTSSFSAEVPFTDRASVENAATVIAACLAEGLDEKVIASGIASLQPVAMRMELKKGINGSDIIEDYYNSDPGSLVMALEYLVSGGNLKTTLILSDFIQSSRKGEELYRLVAAMVEKFGIKRFIGIGPDISRYSSLFGPGSSFYNSTDEFLSRVNTSDFAGETVLLKGARVFEFERIARVLELKMHQTVLEISLDAIAQNLSEFRRVIKPGTKIMAMVKAFAYGSGSSEIAAFLQYNRVDYLAVAYADEGAELRRSGIQLPVMVMNPETSAFDSIIGNYLEPELYSPGVLKSFNATASRYGLVGYPVHIKIDTGMHRLGFVEDETDELIGILKQSDSLKVVSVFTHLAATEDPSLDEFTHIQIKRFNTVTSRIEKDLGYSFLRHALNSAGIARFPEYHFDMVRPGIGIYGASAVTGLSLRHAGRFISAISQVKRVRAGEPVGYGCLAASDRDRIIAIVPVGYADGLDRRLGNGKGSLFVRGRKCPTVGNICMDMCMIDVTGAGAAEGDHAEIFGNNIPVEEVAELSGTIPYEVITSVSPRVKRIFIRE